MDLSEVYALQPALVKGAVHVSVPDVTDGFQLLRGEFQSEEPIVCEPHSGKLLCDFLSTTWGIINLISPHFIKLLVRERFNGWRTHPVRVKGFVGKPLREYAILSVIGRCGEIQKELSRRERRRPIVPKGKPFDVCVGLYFDPTSWDGSDIFLPVNYGLVLITQEVKVAIEEAGLTNIQLTPISEYEQTAI